MLQEEMLLANSHPNNDPFPSPEINKSKKTMPMWTRPHRKWQAAPASEVRGRIG
jgi:hypothetical protein